MTLSLTVSLGYITIPFIIKSSIRALTTDEEEDSELGTPQWTFGNTISISYFLQSPPTNYPTLEKHVLQLAPQAHAFEKEQLEIISNAFRGENKRTHGLISIADDFLGILSSSDKPTIFTLHVVQFESVPPIHRISNKSYSRTEIIPSMDQCLNPSQLMSLCQMWPNSQEQLVKIAGQVYDLSSLYGYWDYWRLFEGICQRYQINPDQLVQSQRTHV